MKINRQYRNIIENVFNSSDEAEEIIHLLKDNQFNLARMFISDRIDELEELKNISHFPDAREFRLNIPRIHKLYDLVMLELEKTYE